MKSRLTKLCSLFLTFAVTATTVFSSDLALVSAYADDDVAIVEEVAVEDAVVEEAVVEEEVAADAVVVESLEDGEIVEALDSELPAVSVNSITEKDYDFFTVVADTKTRLVTVSWNDISISANKYFVGDYYWDADDLTNVYENEGFLENVRGVVFEGKYAVDYYTVAIATADNDIYFSEVYPELLERNTDKDNDKGLLVSFDTDADEYITVTDAPGKFYYTGKNITPSIVVADGVDVLELGKDYKLSYKNNKKPTSGLDLGINAAYTVAEGADSAKAPYIEVKFIGDYKGTASVKKYFEIVPAEIGYENEKDVVAEFMDAKTVVAASNRAQATKPSLTIKTYNYKKGWVKSVVLKAGATKDYQVKYVSGNVCEMSVADFDALKDADKIPANPATGDWTVLVKGNGSTVEKSVKCFTGFKVVDPAKDLSKANVTMSENAKYDVLYDKDFDVTDIVKEIKIGRTVVSANVIENVRVNWASQKPGKNAKLDVTIKDDAEGYVSGTYYGVKSNLKIENSGLFDSISVNVAGVAALPKNARDKKLNVSLSWNQVEGPLTHVVFNCVDVEGLVCGDDYTISYAKKTPLFGKTKITLVGDGKYRGEKKDVNVELKAKIEDVVVGFSYWDASDDYVELKKEAGKNSVVADKAVCYAKKAVDIIDVDEVYVEGTDLSSKDIAVSYSKIKEGKFTATIKFKGDYKSLGKMTVDFTTVPESHYYEIEATATTVNSATKLTADKLIKKSKIKVTDKSGTALKATKDYTVSTNLYQEVDGAYVPVTVSANAVVSENTLYYAKVDGIAAANYTFEGVYVELRYGTMFKANQVSANKGIVETHLIRERNYYVYEADLLKTITLKDKTVLTRDVDYTIEPVTPKKLNEFDYMSKPGIKNVKITMKDGKAYTGSVVVKVEVKLRNPEFGHKDILSK